MGWIVCRRCFDEKLSIGFVIYIDRSALMEGSKINSVACRFQDFSESWYSIQERDLKIRDIFRLHSAAGVDFVNRKFWEWCVISKALDEAGVLVSGARGLGFAVGTEPLASYFASKGCKLLATDLATELSSKGWIDTNEHASSLDQLFYPALLDRERFLECVSFDFADMRNIQGVGQGYDFIWSSCALEHLGTLGAGFDFIVSSAKLLRKGGVAVHTTEFNVGSGIETITKGPNVVFRKMDFVLLDQLLESLGFRLRPLNFDTGSHEVDLDVDFMPYMQPGKRHVKLDIDGVVATSFLLVVERL